MFLVDVLVDCLADQVAQLVRLDCIKLNRRGASKTGGAGVTRFIGPGR